MQLVKRLCVREVHWSYAQSGKLVLDRVDPYREEKGTHWLTPAVAATFELPLDHHLIGRHIEYTFTHRVLTGERRPVPDPRQPAAEPEVDIMYTKECSAQGVNTVLLDEVRRRETWSWMPNSGYRPDQPLDHRVHYFLKVASWFDEFGESSPFCSLTVELTPEEYAECIQLPPGSVFDLTLRLLPPS